MTVLSLIITFDIQQLNNFVCFISLEYTQKVVSLSKIIYSYGLSFSILNSFFLKSVNVYAKPVINKFSYLSISLLAFPISLLYLNKYNIAVKKEPISLTLLSILGSTAIGIVFRKEM